MVAGVRSCRGLVMRLIFVGVGVIGYVGAFVGVNSCVNLLNVKKQCHFTLKFIHSKSTF